MKPAPFEYKAPRSLDEALVELGNYAGDAKVLAGGQSLVPAMNFRVVQPGALIDLNGVDDLAFIKEDNQVLRIGAMTRERQLESDPHVVEWCPLLAEAMPHIAHPQIRNRGTIGGSLANADPAAELPVVMLAARARLRLRSTSGERWISAADFFVGMFATALAPDELLVEIELPRGPSRTGWSFLEIAPRAGDYALMGIAAQVSIDKRGFCTDARLVYLNAGDGPVQATEAAAGLQGQQISSKMIESAAALASAKEINPYGNIHASPAYQRHLANVLTRRALELAVKRAGVGRQA